MLKIKKISDVIGRNAYTDSGDLLGQIEEVNLVDNKVDGWRIKVSGAMSHLIGGARGIIVPHQFVKAVGDIFIVNRTSLPIREDEQQETDMVELEVNED